MNPGNDRSTQDSQSPRWAPESPFHDATPLAVSPSPPISVAARTHESPFLNEIGDRLTPADPASRAVQELLTSLHDPEFDVGVYELVHELSGLATVTGEIGDGRAYEARVERAIDDRLAPLARAYEDRVDELNEHLAPLDAGAMTEAELEAILERTAAPHTALGPAFEFFLKKLWEKTKKAVKGAVGLVKKGVQAVGKLAIKPVLVALRKLIRPLLKKVLAMAMDKIPEKYRPLAEKIAAKLGEKRAAPAVTSGASGAPEPAASSPAAEDASASTASTASTAADPAPAAATGAAPAEPAAPPASEIQNELDGRFAELLLARDEMEMETMLATHEAEASRVALDPVGELERGRARFVRSLSSLRDGEDPRPLVENFIPAILAAVKLGIKIIGRKRVVGFLGGLLGKLIGPIVGKDIALPLATLVSDIGMKLMGFELSAAEQEAAGARAVADTVEETVRRVAVLPAYVLDNEALLESHVLEAFESAAAASFPPTLIREELREASGVEAMWVPVPPRGRAQFKKFSRTFEVTITRPIAESIRGFHGRGLEKFLGEVLRASFPVRARVHLFELVAGGRLAHIAELDRARGLGRADGYRLLHPLTPHAAATLLQHPRLGTPFGGAPDPLHARVGERFYYLEIDEGGEARVPGQAPGRASSLGALVDLARGEIRVRLYLGEPAAQRIATALRKGPRGAVLVHGLRQLFSDDAARLGSSENHGLLRIAVDPPGPDDRASLASVARQGQREGVRRELGAAIARWMWIRLADFAGRGADELVRATEAPDEGVTLLIVFANPPRLAALRRLLRGGAASADDRWPPDETPAAQVRVFAGHRPD